MADAVRNIIMKLGRKVHSLETATKHVKTLLQLAMKKKLKLDSDLHDEIMVTVLSDYPEFYADWSEDDTSELLMLASEVSDEVCPTSIPEPADGNRAVAFLQYFAQRALESEEVSRRRAAAQPRYLQAAQDEATRRIEFLPNRSNTSESPIEISLDKPDDLVSDVIPSALPIVETDNKDKSSDLANDLSLVVYSAEKVTMPSIEIVVSPREICPSENPSSLPTEIEAAGISNPHASDQIDGVPVYTSSSLAESFEHIRHFASLPTASIPEPYHVIHPSESSSEDEKILAEVYGPQAHLSKPPSVEATAHHDSTPFKIREVTSLLGSSSVQVSKTSHSMYPSPSAHSPSKETRKSKRKSVPVKVVVESGDDNLDVAQPEKRRKSVGLLKTVSSICPYLKLLTYEFYCNLNEEIDNLSGTRPMQIFIRGKWYVFGPDMINEYYGLKGVHKEEITDWDLVAKTLTGGQTDTWPTGEKDYLSSSQLTSKYVILHRLALHNWLPSAHFHTVGKQLAALLFRIGTKMPIDLGSWIYYHILTLIHPREPKVRLPFPNLIFGVLTSQGLEPMPSEVISPTLLYTVDPRLLTGGNIRDVTPVIAPSTSDADTLADVSPHAKDVQLSLHLKARVSELETVHGIIAKQLTGARTELATVLFRLSFMESAAADAA
ncbi:PREDICTED: uncharacterized protein LOC109179182 [Ipomoea nil]|uniref:uncharacterized protein LOC109179182 n=1 Tax=Ipomoea nil TaxID=35883 RepID=UPI000901A288|nr:PREDICTED: uncharacterized protein LOC109179182 [Ipomoea nil]